MNNSRDVILPTTPLVDESVWLNSGCLRSGQEVSLVASTVVDLREQGVMVGAIVFPMVPRDKARVRTQISSGLSREDLDEVLAKFDSCGRELGLI